MVVSLALLGLSIPEFWLGLVLVWLVAVLVPIFPAGDYVAFAKDPLQWARHLALPTFTRACIQMGFVARMTRSSMLATKVTPAALIACRSVGAKNQASSGF